MAICFAGKWKNVVLIELSKVEECFKIYWESGEVLNNLVTYGVRANTDFGNYRNIYFSTLLTGEIKGMLAEIRGRDGCTEGHGRRTLSCNEAYRFVYVSCIISWLDGAIKNVNFRVSVCLLNCRPAQASLPYNTHVISALD